MALFTGGTVVLSPEFDADAVWRVIEQHKVNLLFFTGDAMARPLLDALEGSERDLSSLFLLSSTAALFSPSLKESFLELLPNRVITDSIGSSETGFGGTSVVAKGQSGGGGPRGAGWAAPWEPRPRSRWRQAGGVPATTGGSNGRAAVVTVVTARDRTTLQRLLVSGTGAAAAAQP
jgi:acyl-CoA synthetase (AMP-forming)/AMP-acid ligase II